MAAAKKSPGLDPVDAVRDVLSKLSGHLTLSVEAPNLEMNPSPEEYDSFLMSLDYIVHMALTDSQRLVQELAHSAEDGRGRFRVLLVISQRFTKLMQDALDGNYADSYFRDGKNELERNISDLIRDFEEKIRGKSYSQWNEVFDEQLVGLSPQTDRAAVIEKLQRKLGKGHQIRVPGLFDNSIIKDMFELQTRPWRSAAKDLHQALESTCSSFLDRLIIHLTGDSGMAIDGYLNDALLHLQKERGQAIDEMLAVYQSRRFKLYRQQMQVTLTTSRNEELRHSFRELFSEKYGTRLSDNYAESVYISTSGLNEILDEVERRQEDQLKRQAYENMVDYLEEYYKVNK